MIDDITKMTLFDDFGSEDTVEISGLTISLTNTLLPAHPRPKIRTGDLSVTGSIEVYWTGSQLKDWCRAASAAQENRMMRVIRPHMGKRQFQRFRGALLANRRTAWRDA